jgi:TolB-like protein/AraC-like DNA-binding protein
MSQPSAKFIDQAKAIILEHLSNEQFGVSELAALMHMSRSNLLRKIKKNTLLSASQFIRQVRLEKAKELLNETEMSISEIAYEVGFGNNSYFIKCFKDEYGYPPGKARKKGFVQVEEAEHTIEEEENASKPKAPKFYQRPVFIAVSVIIVLVGVLTYNAFSKKAEENSQGLKKSIAVLPFKNLSSDSTNLYFVNGLMEAALNNLQKIEDLRVISRTSVEKYRNTNKSIKDIAEELNVNYIIEGSGQRANDEVLLNIQLIDAANESPIWAEQYKNKIGDVFVLQNSIAKKIVEAIQATVTPAELEQIDKKPTESLVAYDYYLQAMQAFQLKTKEGLEKAIPLFKKAIHKDSEFALAYSKTAIAYFYLDLYQTQKKYTDTINNYADKALLYDAKSAESLIAKALFYLNTQQYQFAIPHLEKALEYNPNSSSVVQMLSDMYARVTPNTGKYLKYALKGIQLDIASNDSINRSYIYLHLSNAFIQSGFTEEASTYIDLSLQYNPQNEFASLLKIFIDYPRHKNMQKIKNDLVKEWQKDTTRLDILQEAAKFYYFEEEYESAYYYYEKFVHFKQLNGLEMYPQEDLKIGIVYEKMGFSQEANSFYEAYANYCDKDQSIYKSASLASKYAHEKQYDEALAQLKNFATQNDFQYWIVLFLDKDPVMKSLLNNPEFQQTLQQIESRFWENHQQIRASLEAKELI